MSDREIAMVLMYHAFDMDMIGLDAEIMDGMKQVESDLGNIGDALRETLERITEPDLEDAERFWQEKGGKNEE